MLPLLLPLVLLLAHTPPTLSLPLNGPSQTAFLPSPPPLNIHIIPHSHDDLGWLRTINQYYIGDPNYPKTESVQRILDSIIPVLQHDPTRKFIYVEVGFFKIWWNDQNEDTKTLVRQLVKNGQLEFINGGYAMNDEADVYYEDCIEQMTLGHQFLLQNFNVTPEVGWQIDPFGHASAQAAMFAQMGFKAFYMARIDYQDKEKRLREKGMEMVWVPGTSQGNENAILVHVNYHHYSNPTNFCFDILCNDQEVTSWNVEEKAKEFVSYFNEMSNGYRSRELMHTAGDDFHFMNAERNYQNYDTLFSYLKDNGNRYNVKVFYSTPSEYLKAIYPLNVEYPLKTDDFFPYADHKDAYWTGYFTSRPSLKELTRQEGRFLQATRRLATQLLWEKGSSYMQGNFGKVDQAIGKLEDAVAVAQHHDAVAGTEKQLVAEDYKERLSAGEGSVQNDFLFPAISELIQKDLGLEGIQLNMCQVNESASLCEVTYNNLQKEVPVLLAVYNSAPERASTIQVKVPNAKIQVLSKDGANLGTDVICSNKDDTTDCDLFFSDNFKGYDTAYYYLKSSSESNEAVSQQINFNQDYKINPTQTISLDKDLLSFNLKSCKDEELKDCYNTQFSLMYNYYTSFDELESQKSGAYIFRPQSTESSYARPSTGSLYQGKNLLQIRLDSDKIKTNIRIYNDLAKGIEVQSFVNSINVDDRIGKEIVMLVSVPSIQNKDTFYTDSMGMEMQKRVLNFRPTWDLEVNQPVAGNYYPVQSAIQIKDEASGESFSISPDRAQGGSSLHQGQIELMIHRRILADDGRGVGEPLNELDRDGNGLRQLVTHVLLFNKPGYIETTHRQVQMNIDMPNLVMLGAVSQTSFKSEKSSLFDSTSFNQLGKDIKVMTRPLSDRKFLLRFQNMGELEDGTVSTAVFKSSALGQGSVVEMSLTANQAKSEMIKKKFNWNGLKLNDPSLVNNDYLNSDQFKLRPLEIRTFVVTFGEPQAATTVSLYYSQLLSNMMF